MTFFITTYIRLALIFITESSKTSTTIISVVVITLVVVGALICVIVCIRMRKGKGMRKGNSCYNLSTNCIGTQSLLVHIRRLSVKHQDNRISVFFQSNCSNFY